VTQAANPSAPPESETLTWRYWATYGLIVAQLLGEIFDFIIVGFLVSSLAGQWRLTYGAGAIIFLAAGLGAMLGAVALGLLADRFGRKIAIVGGGLLYSVAAGSVAFVPDGNWMLFAVLRFFVGVGYGGAGASQFALVVEATPARYRTAFSSALAAPAAIGIPLASVVVASFYPALGWRGIAALGFVPIAFALALGFVAPESKRWLGQRETRSAKLASLRGVFAERRRAALIVITQICFGAALTGVLLWGPTLTAEMLNLPVQKAASAFFWVTSAGIAGRLAFIWFAVRLGRRVSGMMMGFGGALFLALAAFAQGSAFGLAPAFVVFLAIGQFFYDGGYANLNPYAAELYQPRIAATAMGVSTSAGGIGKIVGPLVLGLIAGGNELISPKATQGVVLPGFLTLSAFCFIGGLCYLWLGIETRSKARARSAAAPPG
jgi:MFS transporter, putative metabolite:H+ symporter